MASNYYQNQTFNGLGSLAMKMPDAGPMFVAGNISLPTLTDGGGVSQLVVTITNTTSSTLLYTGVAGATGFYKSFPVAAGDVVTIAFTSAAAVDQSLNVIKATIATGYGY